MFAIVTSTRRNKAAEIRDTEMKIVKVTNDNLVIQARNEADYKKALEVAKQMNLIESMFVVTATCATELWVQVCASWDNKQAMDLQTVYKMAKEAA